MFVIGLYIFFFLHSPPSFAQSCFSQPPRGNVNPIFWESSNNEEDIAKLQLLKNCLSNLEDCAKGIPLEKVIQEVTSTSGAKNNSNFTNGDAISDSVYRFLRSY